MILGKIVVSSACPTGPREILEDGKSGLLFGVGDADEFAKKIFLILNDQNKRRELEENIKIRVKDFTSDKSLEKLDLVVRELGVRKNE